MKLRMLILTGLAGIAVTACTTAPTIPTLETGVLQEVQNLEVYPNTTDNKAKLTKFTNKCMIEFTGNLQAGKAIEHWSFKGNTLITGGSTVFAQDGTSTATNFDLNDAAVQKNFLALRHYFHKDALAQCN